MAYSAPELLLVGAAQNLVLCPSLVKTDDPCGGEQEDGVPDYDGGGLW